MVEYDRVEDLLRRVRASETEKLDFYSECEKLTAEELQRLAKALCERYGIERTKAV